MAGMITKTEGYGMGEIIARRQFDPLYIWLDIIFLLIFMGLLLYKKKFTTVVVGLIFGLVYMAVDYGIFHLLCHARSIETATAFSGFCCGCQ